MGFTRFEKAFDSTHTTHTAILTGVSNVVDGLILFEKLITRKKLKADSEMITFRLIYIYISLSTL